MALFLSSRRGDPAWRVPRGARLPLALGAALLAGAAGAALPPSLCSSDGVKRPFALLDRFVNADCASCWAAADSPVARPGTVALDWVVPGQLGEEAPLSAVARREGLERLASLGHAIPAASATQTTPAAPARRQRLRVAHGLPLGGYVGASVTYLPPAGGVPPFTAVLALVETLPPGTEGSPVERNLVRNVHTQTWDASAAATRPGRVPLKEMRVLNIPEGARPERLRVVGWVQDARGRTLAVAESRCKAVAATE